MSEIMKSASGRVYEVGGFEVSDMMCVDDAITYDVENGYWLAPSNDTCMW